MPRTNGPRHVPAFTAEDASSADPFVEALMSNESKICDANVKLNGDVIHPVSLSYIVRDSDYFKTVYMTNGIGPFRDVGLRISMSSEIFRLALRFLYSKHSPFLTSVEKLQVGYDESDSLQSICAKVTKLMHAAQFLQCSKLFKLSKRAMLGFVGKFPRLACTALETMNIDGNQIYNKDDPVFDSVKTKLLKIISQNKEEALLKTSIPQDSISENERILALSAGSLRSLVSVLREDVEFSIKALFFWATKGTTLRTATMQMLQNPGGELGPRIRVTKEVIKTLPLEDLNPEFVSSFMFNINLVNKDSVLQLSHSALKRALEDTKEVRKKLTKTTNRLNRLESENRNSRS